MALKPDVNNGNSSSLEKHSNKRARRRVNCCVARTKLKLLKCIDSRCIRTISAIIKFQI